MGIRGLQGFMERECPDACRHVSIEQLADNHRNRFNLQPVIAVDGMCLLNPLYMKKTGEWIYGGQWVQFVSVLEHFIMQFKKIGVKLVFFFDGTVSGKKRKEWVRRRVSKYKQIQEVFQHVRVTCQQPPDDNISQIPIALDTLTEFALQDLGEEVFQTDREADDELADYALRHQEVFAILTQDSDFIIYNTKPYLSVLHLDLDTMSTVLYDRDVFASSYLNLFIAQLPLFACLMGNDYISSDQLRPFHQSLSINGRIYFSAIAGNLCRVIRLNRWLGDPRYREELVNISEIVFGNQYMADLLQESLKSYVISGGQVQALQTIRVSSRMERERKTL